MPSYTFHVGYGKTVCEMSDIVLSDPEAARDFAIGFAAAIFRLHPDLCGDDWERCAVQVMEDADEVFSTTMPEAALIERDELRRQSLRSADN